MKKFLALVTSLVLVAMMFTGCSSDEKAFYQTAKSMSTLQNFQYTGSLAFKVPTLKVNPSSTSTSTDTTTATEMETLRKMIDKASIGYSGAVDSKNHKITLNLKLKMGIINLQAGFILNNAKNNSLLDVSANVATLLSSYIPSTIPHTVVTISKVQYYQYDLKAILAQLKAAQSSGTDTGADTDADSDTDTGISIDTGSTDSAAIVILSELTTATNPTAVQQSLKTKLLTFGDTLINKSFNKLTLGLVTKKANTYTLHITTQNAVTALGSLLTYISKNATTFKMAIASFANSLTDSEIASLNISEVTTKAQLLALLNQVDLSSLSSVVPTLTSELAPIIKGLNLDIKYTLAKTNATTYNTTQAISFDDLKYTDAPLFISLSITGKETVIGK